MQPNSPEVLTERERLDRLRLGLFSHNTTLSYGYDWARFRAWAEKQDRASLPATPETVSLYLSHVIEGERRKVSTATRYASAINHHHFQNGHATPITPEVRLILKGARRIYRERPRQMMGVTVPQLRAITALLLAENQPGTLRDRAILVVGLAAALRSSSLIAIHVEDLEFRAEGVVLSIRREKQDPIGRFRKVGLPHGKHVETCPVRALEDWLARRPGNASSGPLFTRLDYGGKGGPLERNRIRRIVHAALKRGGIDVTGYGSHSLRVGLVTEAADAGVSELVIAAQTGHRSMTVLRNYYRRSDLFRVNPAAMIGL